MVTVICRYRNLAAVSWRSHVLDVSDVMRLLLRSSLLRLLCLGRLARLPRLDRLLQRSLKLLAVERLDRVVDVAGGDRLPLVSVCVLIRGVRHAEDEDGSGSGESSLRLLGHGCIRRERIFYDPRYDCSGQSEVLHFRVGHLNTLKCTFPAHEKAPKLHAALF
ncbi:hypothetical protein PMAYCL1PPCAC_03816, partial [Pristionchus mayeri]